MIDFPIAELLDNSLCLIWLERHLHPDGLACPHCHRPERRLFRQQGDFPAYRCRACDGYYFFLISLAQGIAQVPTDAEQNHFTFKMPPFERG
jgi:hypothetical protein